jgi:hypothetical protein
MATNRTDSDRRTQEYSFDVVDNAGRVVGARVHTFVATFAELPAGVAGWAKKAGTYYGYRPQATRDGERYGASQSDRMFTDEASRDADVFAYLYDARRRAERAFVGRVGVGEVRK